MDNFDKFLITEVNKELDNLEEICEKRNWERTTHFDEGFEMVETMLKATQKIKEEYFKEVGSWPDGHEEITKIGQRFKIIKDKYFKENLN